MDLARYGDLLKDACPAVIDSPEEHERLMALAESLMERGDSLAEEERRLLELLVFLIREFEMRVEHAEADEDEDDGHAEPPQPHETLSRLMEARGLGLDDIQDIFGNPAAARDALDGRKPITRGQAKELARYFQMPEKLLRPR